MLKAIEIPSLKLMWAVFPKSAIEEDTVAMGNRFLAVLVGNLTEAVLGRNSLLLLVKGKFWLMGRSTSNWELEDISNRK